MSTTKLHLFIKQKIKCKLWKQPWVHIPVQISFLLLEGVNPCVTPWSDGSVKWSFWRYGGGGGRGSILGQKGVI